MSNMVDKTTIVVPVSLRDKLAKLRIHPRQPLWEVIEMLAEVKCE